MSRTTIRGGTLVPLETDAKTADPPVQATQQPKDKDEYTDTMLDRWIKLCTITWCGCEVIAKTWSLVDRAVR
jgi:hypothetical protein